MSEIINNYISKNLVPELSGRPATTKEIHNLEKVFQFLPKSYLQIVKQFGAPFFDSMQIHGLGSPMVNYGTEDDPKYTLLADVIDLWNLLHEEFYITNKVLPFYDMGNGDYIAINLYKFNHETQEAPIYYLAHESFPFNQTGVDKDQIDYSKDSEYFEPTRFDSFGQWLESVVNNGEIL